METAEGSFEECRYFCILARDLGYTNTVPLREALDVITPVENK
jgi:hypothetical protein